MFKINGFSGIAEFFEHASFPDKQNVFKTTIQVGAIRYRNCAFLYINNDGLFVKIKMVFKTHPTIFIPWNAFKEKKPATLYGLRAIEFVFTDSNLPALRLYESDINKYENLFSGIKNQ